jgi:hypothetical protein
MPEDMPDRMPEDMPDNIPEDLGGRMPEDMPDRMPEVMPEGMPDRMPDKMSDRMPEDLPVTKCINVMVGITRSKVFFLCFSKSTQMCGYFGGTWATAKFGRSAAKFGRSMAKFSRTTVASRSRQPPISFPFVFFTILFHGRFPVTHSICWGWLRQP